MRGLMQQHELLISTLLDYAERYHPRVSIVSRLLDGAVHRSDWGAVAFRARQLASALQRLGIKQGERVATLAWNHKRHLELFFGVTGSGLVLHTVNPRLFREQLRYIISHAENTTLFFDTSFTTLVEELAPHIPSVRHYVALCAQPEMPVADLPRLLCYEDLLAAESDEYLWPRFDENSASSLCYTSGTTGNPKGVLYSHRSTAHLRADGCGHHGDLRP